MASWVTVREVKTPRVTAVAANAPTWRLLAEDDPTAAG
jgi:hypothetical protein